MTRPVFGHFVTIDIPGVGVSCYAVSGHEAILIPGGLYEDVGAVQFWVGPGIVQGLQDAGINARPFDRLRSPRSWEEDADELLQAIRASYTQPVVLVAASNGCSTAVRVAVDHPDLVRKLILCWPATADDLEVDKFHRDMITATAGRGVAQLLLDGATMRGITDTELSDLTVPTALVPANPENLYHRWYTVDSLAGLIPDATITDGFPESPRPEFADFRDYFLVTLIKHIQ